MHNLINNKIHNLYLRLLEKHGHPGEIWPEWCMENKSLEVREMNALGAILGQRTSWRNAEQAIRNLNKAGMLSIPKLAKSQAEDIKELIRVSGFFQTKPRRLIEFSKFVIEHGGLKMLMQHDIKTLRSNLLDVYGIGPETADTIMLFALDKPSFIIDDYTKKILKRENITTETNYLNLKELFEESLPKSVEVYQNFHALIIIDQKGKAYSTMALVLGAN